MASYKRLPAHVRHLLRGVALSAAVGGVLGGIIALLISPRYSAEIAVIPVSTDGRELSGGGMLSGLAGQFGGLAALAGIGGSDSSQFESIETLQSRQLATRFIESNKLMPILFARRWDAVAGRWKPSFLHDDPTLWDGDKVLEKIVKIREDRRTGIVRLSVSWGDRDRVAEWANGIVASANELLRQAALQRAVNNLAFLNQQIDKTNVVEVRQTVFRLIETEMKKLMLAQTTSEYAFRVIDPAVTPKERDWPKPIPMILFGGFLGATLWLLRAAVGKAINDYIAASERGS